MKVGKIVALLVWIALLVLALGRTTRETARLSQAHNQLLTPPAFIGLDTRLINIMTLGYRGVYDDYLAIAALQFLADKQLLQESPEAVNKAITDITRHHPRNEALYMLSCFVLAFDLKRADFCEKITLDGMKALPSSWRIPSTQGFIAAYRFNDLVNGALYYDLAASRAGAPPYFKSLVEKMKNGQNINQEEVQETLKGLFGTTDQEQLKSILSSPDAHTDKPEEPTP